MPDEKPTSVILVGSIERNDIDAHRDTAAMGYIWFLSIPVYFFNSKSPYIRFHSRQGIVLFGASLIAFVIPILWKTLLVIVFFGMLYGFVNAVTGKVKDVPLVGPISRGE
ncbi:MAG: hypothetical protein Q7R81_00850 [Candidatus Peregrinibacteria bacterium]|nr:hypothetical protein [Candidatus Peregrinibacteria bacterium]